MIAQEHCWRCQLPQVKTSAWTHGFTHVSLLRLGYKVHNPPGASLQNAKRSTAFISYEPIVSSGPGRPQMRDVRGYHARKTMKNMILQVFTFLIKFLLKNHQICTSFIQITTSGFASTTPLSPASAGSAASNSRSSLASLASVETVLGLTQGCLGSSWRSPIGDFQ